jgi:hypothetical protein
MNVDITIIERKKAAFESASNNAFPGPAKQRLGFNLRQDNMAEYGTPQIHFPQAGK